MLNINNFDFELDTNNISSRYKNFLTLFLTYVIVKQFEDQIEAKAEEERLRSATEDEKKKILQAAEQEIAAASNLARRQLKQFAAELAVSLAEKRITVNDAADKMLVRDFTKNLAASGDGAKGGT